MDIEANKFYDLKIALSNENSKYSDFFKFKDVENSIRKKLESWNNLKFLMDQVWVKQIKMKVSFNKSNSLISS